MRKLGLLCLFLALTGCGRGEIDLYRAYNISPMRDSSGKVAQDLASQNRNRMQTGGEYTYLYVPPTQADPKDEKDSSETQTSDDSTSADEDASLPDDAASDGKQSVIDKIDSLKNAVDALKKK